jgi:hypothetical protein
MKKPVTWVVYERLIKGVPSGSNSVCEQREWDEMEAQRPGDNVLIKSEIANEGEAERFARTRSDLNAPVKPTVKSPRRPFVAPMVPGDAPIESAAESIATPL